MSWLKRIEPTILHHGSELPFVILDDGVHLCFDNFFSESCNLSEHNLVIKANKNDIKRKSTIYYSFKQFPKIIPFSDIISLNDTIIDGRLIKSSSEYIGNHSEIAVVTSEYLKSLEDEDFQDFVDSLEDYDTTFLLRGDEIDSQSRLLSGMVETVMHHDWYRTAVTIEHKICKKSDRKYCWTNTIPDLSISFYGFENSEDLDGFKEALEYTGILSYLVTWQ